VVNRYARIVVAASIAVVAFALLQSVALPFTSRDVHGCAGTGTTRDWCGPGTDGTP
jgi:hypothetical protein